MKRIIIVVVAVIAHAIPLGALLYALIWRNEWVRVELPFTVKAGVTYRVDGATLGPIDISPQFTDYAPPVEHQFIWVRRKDL